MLGTVAQQPIDAILYALASGDAKALFTKIGEIADLTPDFSSILPQILRVLHRIALVQQFPEFIDDEFDEQLIQNLARLFTPEDVQLFYQIGLLGQRDLDLAPDERTGFEMVMLRMLTFRPQTADAYAETSSRKSTPPPVIHSPAGAAYAAAPPNKPAPEAPPAANDKPGENWPEIIARLQLTGLSRELANNCILESIDEKVCRLQIDPGYKQISVKAEEKLGGALQKYYSRPLKLLITPMTELRMTPAHEMQKARDDMQQAAIDSIETDKNIHDLKNTFSARIVNGSIESLNE
jgi:DNA polymerase-3 subunit gamma/tau